MALASTLAQSAARAATLPRLQKCLTLRYMNGVKLWLARARWRRGAALAAVLAVAAGAPSAETGAPAAPRLEPPEEVLAGAVHLAWRDEHTSSAARYELERRQRSGEAWGAWAPVVAKPTAPAEAHVDDPGVGPGTWQYRVRGLYGAGDGGQAWSQWSEPAELALPEACSGQTPPSPDLPVVVADDRNGDGRTTGADLELALRDCSARGGCVLQALPAAYDDVAIVLYDGDPTACEPARTACLNLPFPNGLVIQGHGSATEFRSPLWKSPYHPVALLELWKRPDVRIWLRNLVLDGRKAEQGDPTPGQQDSSSWWHYGFQAWNQWGDHTRRNRDGCFHNVVVRNFMSRGISLMDVANWSIDHSAVEDIGCLEGFTPCPKLRIPDGFETPGYRSPGIGILIGWYADDVRVTSNRIRRATKYSIGLKHGTDGEETSIRRPRVDGNQILEAGSTGIFVAGVADGRFRNNVVDSTHMPNARPEQAPYYNTFAVSCSARVDRTSFAAERWLDSSGSALNWQCRGDGNLVADTLIEGSCREKNPKTCVPGNRRACYDRADINVTNGAGGRLRLERTEVRGTRCATPLEVSAPIFLVIDGGRFARGTHGTRSVLFHGANVTIQRGARFEDVGVEFSNTYGVVTKSIERRRFAWRMDSNSKLLVCADDPERCQALCSAPKPPEWCSE
jgi:hypothetical protein